MVCLYRVQRNGRLMLLWALMAIAVMSGPIFSQASGPDPDDNPALEKKRLAAQTTYELIVGYIEKEDYAKAQKETRNLLDLKLPAKFDNQLREAILRISMKLSDKRQYQTAHAVVDMALKDPMAHRDDNEAYLLLAKAQ